jgi:hypothetical protein
LIATERNGNADIEEEELDDGSPKLRNRPWIPGKDEAAQTTSVVSKSKGKALKRTGAMAAASS